LPETRLNPRYTFEEFVVGPHSRFPHAAAQAVSENLGKAYNPLFIYGPVGVGKTHLMQAVGHRVLGRDGQTHVLYITAEEFMTDVIDLLRSGNLKSFRDNFRSLDLLMVDDVQFLSASESTQEEFFHTFNALHQAGKQIIMTSDRPPKMLTTLEDRLRSRFEWGLIADIKSPSLETRVAILRKKESQFGNMQLGEDIRLYIAGKLKSNVRELEGFLRRVQAYAQLNNQTINLPVVKEIMRELLPPSSWDEEDQAALAETQHPGHTPPAGGGKAGVAPVLLPPVSAPPAAAGESAHRVTPAISPDAIKIDSEISIVLPPAVEPRVETGPKSVVAAFFYPAGKERELAQLKQKFEDVIHKHKLKFQLDAATEAPYPLEETLSYDTFVQACAQKSCHIAIVLGPPPGSRLKDFDFHQKLQELFDSHRVSLQLIPWEELGKDYRFLNIALDITLIRYKEKAP